MKRLDRKSDCAINYTLENIGDAWSMLIVRDMVYYGKTTFGEFLASDERMGTGVLTRRLVSLQKAGIITSRTLQKDKRKTVYRLTEKGLDLIPLLLDMAKWGSHYDAHTGASHKWIQQVEQNRSQLLQDIREKVKLGQALFKLSD